ncbi:hypothetical protein WA026_013031 [Henosepilachna vigintioctopunctata]|uniref:Uncharacterized protein n=1 Tax=Henosepilachna vigintioctopunctata TaxID=420089 RepID=A0AAW1UDV9_9CUCU
MCSPHFRSDDSIKPRNLVDGLRAISPYGSCRLGQSGMQIGGSHDQISIVSIDCDSSSRAMKKIGEVINVHDEQQWAHDTPLRDTRVHHRLV